MRPHSALVTLLLLLTASIASRAGPVGGDIRLIDHQGQPFSLEQTRGKVAVIAFGYTFCPDICPTTLAVIAAAMRALGEQGEQVQPIFVSLDPDRDTPERLEDYVRYFDPRMIGLTGSAEAIAEVAARYKVRYAFVGKGERERYSLDHTASVYIVDRQGRLARIIPYGLPPEVITSAVRDLLDGTQQAQALSGQ